MFKFKKLVPTVAGALAAFEKVRADLKAVKEHHDAEAAKHESAIHAASNKAAEIIAAAEAAATTAINKAHQLRVDAEDEARAAVQALYRIESFLGQ